MPKKLFRSRDNRIVCGVAAGIAAYAGIDATVVRLIWVVALLAGLFPAIVAYAAGCFLIPEEPILD